METEDYCSSKLQIIPQFSGTCWFNSILTVMLYSDNFRKYLKSHFESMSTYPKYDKLFMFLLFMIKNHNKIEELEKVYRSFKNLRLKPEYLLFSYFNKYDSPTKEIIKRKIKYDIGIGYPIIYICHILNTYNIPFINLIKHKNDIYMNLNLIKTYNINIDINIDNINLNEKADNTNILIVNHNYSYLYDLTNIPENKKIKNEELWNSINNIEREIVINSNIFVLDSCIISNSYSDLIDTTDISLNYHAISGIICGKNQFIVDSKDAYQFKNNTTILNENNNLLKYKWYENLMNNNIISVSYNTTTNKQSIITHTTEAQKIVASLNRTKLSYTLDKSIILFIYIKKLDGTRSSLSSSSIESGQRISIKKLELSSKEISKNIKSYYDFYNLTLDELFAKIKNMYNMNSSITISLFENVKDNYNYMFNEYFNMDINRTKSNDELLKILFANLIIHYVKYGKILSFETDETIIKKYINFFINNTNEFIGQYIIDKFRIFVLPENIEAFSKILFSDNPKYYDKYLLKEITHDNIKRLLIRIVLDNSIINEDYITKHYISELNSLSIPNLYKKIENYNQFNLSLLEKNIDHYNDILINHNSKYYDLELLNTIKEKNRQTLIRILLDKIIFNQNYISLYKIYSLNQINNQNLIRKLNEDYSFNPVKEKIDDYYKILFNDNPKYYDNDIKNMVSFDKYKQILIKILLDYEFFDINSITNKRRKK